MLTNLQINDNQFRHHVFDQVFDQVYDQVFDQVWDQVHDQVLDQVTWAAKSPVWMAVHWPL